jgi:hypothetical protein
MHETGLAIIGFTLILRSLSFLPVELLHSEALTG